MKTRELPYCLLPGTHPACAYTPAEQTNLAQRFRDIREQRFAHDVGDDYDDVERTAYLESFSGGFRK